MTATSETLVAVGGARDRARWVMLIVLLCGQFMALLDVTIVNVAMPTIGRSLHTSGAELQLVVAGYTVSYAMLLITGAQLGNLAGRRRMFLTGSGRVHAHVAGLRARAGHRRARRGQVRAGHGRGGDDSQIMSMIQLRFSGAARARALNACTAVLSSGFVAGQVVGGVLVSANLFGTSWRPVYLLATSLGLAVLAPGAARGSRPTVPPGRGMARPGRAGRGGARGVPDRAAADAQGHQENWPASVLASRSSLRGFLLDRVFLYTKRTVASRGGNPHLSLSVFRSPGLLAGLFAMFVLMVTYGGWLFSFAINLQGGLGDNAMPPGWPRTPRAVAFRAVPGVLAAATRPPRHSPCCRWAAWSSGALGYI